MKTLNLKEMGGLNGGSAAKGDACGTYTGLMCAATVLLIWSPFAPFAGATGPACLVGIASGCMVS